MPEALGKPEEAQTAPAVRIAVRALAEYACRSGSIEAGFRSLTSLTEGTRIHKEVQAEYGEGSEREVFLRMEMALGGVDWTVEGRCDGLLAEEGGPVIDEIKSTSGRLEDLGEEGHRVHWMQARGYAYIYAVQQGLERMDVQLTYVQVDSGAVSRIRRSFALDELREGMVWMLEQYAPFARMLRRHRLERNASLERLEFPFRGFRPGQRKLSAAVYKTLEDKGGLFAKAPTGIGKTMSVLWPAVRALGTGAASRLFYLTARTTTRAAAEDAVRRMEEQGLKLHAVTLTAKEKICLQETVSCRKEDCPFADGYYDRINGAMLDLMEHETLMTREAIERYALKHRVCPFEFSLEAAYASDAVICDYNYIYDPKVSLKRFLAEQAKGTALLVDEAHNLPDRARSMYSAELDKAPFLALQRAYKGLSAGLSAAAKGVNAAFIALRKEAEAGAAAGGGGLRPAGPGAYVSEAPPQQLLESVHAFIAQAEPHLAAGGDESGAENAAMLLEAYWAAKAFAAAGEWMDERFVAMAELARGGVKARIMCLDPSHLLQQTGKAYGGRVFFSATLSPLPFYMDQLGAMEEDRSLTLPSPFGREQLEVRLVPLSTRYADRGATLQPLARLLLDAVREKGGNWLAFFPSYAYMNAVYGQLLLELNSGSSDALHASEEVADAGEPAEEMLFPAHAGNQGEKRGLRLRLQRPDMDEEARDRFLAAYQPPEPGSDALLGMAVMGGIFSEGVDLAGERLEGVAVIGVGLPQLGPERDLLAAYEKKQGRSGFDYAYVYPGISKVLQAGGRLIRSESDTGVLLLVDDRYLQPRYQRLLPEEWRSEGAD
ncbi:helicase C-terminal domain-containing protein [Paenibacillus sp. D51F]